MTKTPAPLDPIAQLVAKYQSNSQQTAPMGSQSASQPQQKKSWTGFAERTLWDWLNLLGVLLVPLILGAGTILITIQQSAISQSQHESDQRIANSQRESDQRIADNQFQEALLKTFRDDISHLVLDEHLLTAKTGDPVQIMAQSYTNDALRKLALSQRVLLIQFLDDLHLIVSTTKDSPLILLLGADLSGATLVRAHLSWVNLSGADLYEANLSWANLNGTNLSGAGLLVTELGGANLSETNLSGANLYRADLSETNLSGADLSLADLSGAKVTPEDLALAYSLKDAILPDGSHYPSRSYPIPNHHEPTN